MLPKINSSHGSDTRNIINTAIDSINAQGKSIQDLVAKGQLTPTQYATLIKSINNMAEKSAVRENTKTRPINVAEMDTETKKLFTGGSVAVVGEDAVGRENIKMSAVSPTETNFLEPDKSLNLYDGVFTRHIIGGGVGSFSLQVLEVGRTAKIPVKPNTTYSVIRQPSSRFKIGTDTIESRTSGNLDGSISISVINDDTFRTITTGPNDVVMYVDYTITDENIVLQVVEGVQAELTVSDYTFKPNEKLPIYTKKEVDEKTFESSNMSFLERANLFDGNFERIAISGGSLEPQHTSVDSNSRTAKAPIKPNTTYSVIRQPSSRFKIATDTLVDRSIGNYLDGSVNITIFGSSDTYHSTFTTGPNDVELYVNYTNTDEDIYVEIVEGVRSVASYSDYNVFNPSHELNVYNKEYIDSLSSGGDFKKTLKLLMIGNSFTVDATTFLFEIAQSVGIDIVVGVAYDSGQSIRGHWEKLGNNETITAYNKWASNGYTTIPDSLLDDILVDEDWDIITFQQNSASSDKPTTFQPYLNYLHDYVKNIHPNSRYGLHMTWASGVPGGYESSEEMHSAIVATYQQVMADMEFDLLLPTGTAIENARTNSYLEAVGDRLTMDNAHLERGIGRYIAALCVFEVLFAGYYQKDISDATFYPTVNDSNPFLGYLSKIAVKNAALNPFNVTNV